MREEFVEICGIMIRREQLIDWLAANITLSVETEKRNGDDVIVIEAEFEERRLIRTVITPRIII